MISNGRNSQTHLVHALVLVAERLAEVRHSLHLELLTQVRLVYVHHVAHCVFNVIQCQYSQNEKKIRSESGEKRTVVTHYLRVRGAA